MDGGTERGANGGGGGDDQKRTSSWTESKEIPIEQGNQAEREQLFKLTADRLAMIGDQALYMYDGAAGAAARGQQRPCATDTYTSCSASAEATAAPVVGESIDHDAEHEEIGEQIPSVLNGMQLIRFTRLAICAMQSIVGQDVGMEQLIIRNISDHFAGWLDRGWGSTDDHEDDSLHEESEID